MKIEVLKIAYHRNGVCGEGFHVITFNWKDDNEKLRHMLGIIYKESSYCSILDIDETVKDNIEFANGNSWRGDKFESDLRKTIEEYNKG